MSDDVVLKPEDPVAQEVWSRAAGLTLAFGVQSGNLNPVVVCLAGMLLTIRTAKQRRGLTFDEFVDQARDVW